MASLWNWVGAALEQLNTVPSKQVFIRPERTFYAASQISPKAPSIHATPWRMISRAERSDIL